MSSITEAKAAIASLDGSDLGGRELRVKFSADMVTGRKNAEALNTAPKKDIVFESPHKVYVGNLAWSVRPEDLREHFSQFGTVVSTRVLYDRKRGKNRVYGFLSFSSADELKAAMETSGSVFHGRTLLVREVINREEQ
ncbi:33 kDa ribonucleoprotein, chloroplastic [Cocos nucifera]|nr:33 kDa ribonucleoprotein, chloroplastic [Cocos nucifera]